MLDLIVRDGRVVTADGVARLGIAVRGTRSGGGGRGGGKMAAGVVGRAGQAVR